MHGLCSPALLGKYFIPYHSFSHFKHFHHLLSLSWPCCLAHWENWSHQERITPTLFTHVLCCVFCNARGLLACPAKSNPPVWCTWSHLTSPFKDTLLAVLSFISYIIQMISMDHFYQHLNIFFLPFLKKQPSLSSATL